MDSWILDPLEWAGYYVYVAYGSGDPRPLYVGKTNQLMRRVGSHIFRAPWAADVVYLNLYRFETAEEATVAEVAAIRELNPIHNIVRKKYTGPDEITVDDLTSEELALVRKIQDRRRNASVRITP